MWPCDYFGMAASGKVEPQFCSLELSSRYHPGQAQPHWFFHCSTAVSPSPPHWCLLLFCPRVPLSQKACSHLHLGKFLLIPLNPSKGLLFSTTFQPLRQVAGLLGLALLHPLSLSLWNKSRRSHSLRQHLHLVDIQPACAAGVRRSRGPSPALPLW